jgi:minor extracellular serine protease Vpr
MTASSSQSEERPSLKRVFKIPVFLIVALIGIVVLPLAAGATDLSGNGLSTDGPAASGPSVDTSSAIVQLKGDPLSTYAATRPAPGKKIDFDSNTVKSYRAQLAAERNDFVQWLRANAPNAQVTGQFDLALNAVSVQLNGTSLSTLTGSPLVQQAQYETLYHPASDSTVDPDLSVINAVQAWQANGGSSTAGTGVKVAVIDTGIDITNPCFSDAGYAAVHQLGDPRFTNNKVIVARVFNQFEHRFGYTPEAIQAHGTHVAGTIGCDYNTPVTVNGVKLPHGISGVAPHVLLGNYNVFPGNITNTRNEDMFKALEAAYTDGFDVTNMSIGGPHAGTQDLVQVAVDNLDRAGMVNAIAAGNSGPGFSTVESPGAAPRALTAGASTVPHFVGSPVSVGGTVYGAASGDFATVSSDLSAPLGAVTGTTNGLSTACSALPAGSLTGRIALISRGVCTFSAKIRNAQTAGATAVLVANNVQGDPVAMSSDGTANQPTVPAYMISLANVQALISVDGQATTIGSSSQYFVTQNQDFMAGFSSWGPTPVDFSIKPDVVAPGVNVLSSVPHTACSTPPCFAFFQGTSMATPHLAGSAAVVKWEHPDWSAAAIRSAIVNTADLGILKDYKTGLPVTSVNTEGAGRENLSSAVNARVALDPVSVSFGAVPSISGQTRSIDVTLTNISGATATFQAGVTSGDASVRYAVGPSSATPLAPGQSTTVTVTMAAVQGAAGGSHQAWLTISSNGATVAHAAVFTFIK